MTVTIFVPDIPEFLPLIEGARNSSGCHILSPRRGYWSIVADTTIDVERRALGLGPALWNSALTGGFIGRITEYGRDRLVIVSDG